MSRGSRYVAGGPGRGQLAYVNGKLVRVRSKLVRVGGKLTRVEGKHAGSGCAGT
ncbi:hypothetical protein FB471_4791 [Amycolatopsis cihanbeyliensis]|uniref:Uncharacterized protein n=1 Tax=Amycolatopsis cihanbeyliensis TaxID=1128664 RepID=A0A542DPF8_AMYCI|nr:hypothetical protein FB471_4791 [Amycolatopsis cihanbeyliensis]